MKPMNELTYDEFKEIMLSNQNGSYINEIKQFGLRAYKHFIGKLDPTGIIDFVIKKSERIESIAKEERIIMGMYLLFCGIDELYKKHENLKDLLLSEQVPLLINKYNEKVIHTINPDKIQYLRNLICNGFIN